MIGTAGAIYLLAALWRDLRPSVFDPLHAVRADLGARHVLIRPRCSRRNGKVERFNRTLPREWACHRVHLSNTDLAGCLPATS